jgi:exonuclease SbcC
MQLLRLSLQNFRQYERTTLELGSGLLAVVGPNGAGKSTLLEAIAWALYGSAAARGTKETIKRRGAGPRAKVEVELEFALGTHAYRLVRTLTSAELSQDGQVIANSSGAVTDRIQSLLGMAREEFFNTYFTGQKDLAVMASMTPAERGRFLSRVLGYEKLREVQDRLRVRRSERRAELAGIEQGLADPGELEGVLSRANEMLDAARTRSETATARRSALAESITTLEPEWVAAQERRTAWQGLDGERRVAESQVQAARTAFQALDRELAAALDAQRKLEPMATALVEWPTLIAERESLDRAAAEVTARSQAVARRDQVMSRQQAIAEELATLATEEVVAALRERRVAATEEREALDARVNERRTRWNQDEQEARTKLDFYLERYRELDEQITAIQQAGPEGICPFCQRPLGQDAEHTLELLGAQMEETKASGRYYRQRVEQLRAAPEELTLIEKERQGAATAVQAATESLAKAESQLVRRRTVVQEQVALGKELDQLLQNLSGPAASYDAARHQTVRARLAELEPLRRQHDQLAGLAARAESLVVDAAAAEQRASAVEGACADLVRRIEALGWDPVAFAALEQRMASLREDLQLANVDFAGARAEVEGATQMREAALARQADRAAKAEIARRLANDLERWNELDRAFGELRTELNQQLRPDLRERASAFLQELTRGRYDDLELNEEYVATVVEDGEAKPVISGGEEDVVHLALRLAISQMIADRAGQPLSLLVLDEIFGSLDEERRQAVVDLLRAVGDRFPQVIVISHIEGLRDAFDRVVRVSYDIERGVSTVHDDTPEAAHVAF